MCAVRFRLVPVRRNLLSLSDRFDVYVLDSTGTLIRRWQYVQPNAGGVIELQFALADQVANGTWKIRVDYKGHSTFKSFLVEEYCTLTHIPLPLISYPLSAPTSPLIFYFSATLPVFPLCFLISLVQPRFDVNVSTPYLISETAFGVAGIIHAKFAPIFSSSSIALPPNSGL